MVVLILTASHAPAFVNNGEFESTSGTYPVSITGFGAAAQPLAVIGWGAPQYWFRCKSISETGKLTERTPTLELTPSYQGCEAVHGGGATGATVTNKGCSLRYTIKNESATNREVFEAANELVGAGCVLTFTGGGCTLEIAAQTPITQAASMTDYQESLGKLGTFEYLSVFSSDRMKYTSKGCGESAAEKSEGAYLKNEATLEKVLAEAPWVVSVGESYMSGEGGRWAGNVGFFSSTTPIDALGPSAYYDNGANTGELVAGCHRSHSAQTYIGALANIGVNGKNFACSGARTSSYAKEGVFKPGLDNGLGLGEGQATMLEKFAKTHQVKMILLQIGGTNFNFADIARACVVSYIAGVFSYCSSQTSVLENFTVTKVAEQKDLIKAAILRVSAAMTAAGYSSKAPTYKILIENYPLVLPRGPSNRYDEALNGGQRVEYGCPFYDQDANWFESATAVVNGTLFEAAAATGLTNLMYLDATKAFSGHRVCEIGVDVVQGGETWLSSGVVNKSEWVTQIFGAPSAVFQKQESLHPDYWGQMALRNCVRQAYNQGKPKGGICEISGAGLNAQEEPVMNLRAWP